MSRASILREYAIAEQERLKEKRRQQQEEKIIAQSLIEDDNNESLLRREDLGDDTEQETIEESPVISVVSPVSNDKPIININKPKSLPTKTIVGRSKPKVKSNNRKSKQQEENI